MTAYEDLHTWTKNGKLIQWIKDAIALCEPSNIYLCDGSKEEYEELCKELVNKKVFVSLNPEKRPRSFWCHSDPEDVARVEESTFICSLSPEDAGPTNHWKDPIGMHALLDDVF